MTIQGSLDLLLPYGQVDRPGSVWLKSWAGDGRSAIFLFIIPILGRYVKYLHLLIFKLDHAMNFLNFLFGRSQKNPFDPADADRWANMNFPTFQRHIASGVAGILVEQTGVPWNEMLASTPFSALNVWDDFDTVNFVDALEKRFEISIPEHDRERLLKISDLVEYLYERVCKPIV
jgi:acyl carrier protein